MAPTPSKVTKRKHYNHSSRPIERKRTRPRRQGLKMATSAAIGTAMSLMALQLLLATASEFQPPPSLTAGASGAHKKQAAHFAELDTESVQRVVVGRPVRFKCVVNDIGNHVIAWFHKDKRLLLAIDHKTVAWKDRIQVSSHANSVFFLQIDSVQLGDKGNYTCQLNTVPVQSQIHVLEVVKPPQIIESETTVSMEAAKEFSTVELKCVADGLPKPVIKWRRESQMLVMPASADDLDAEEGEGSNGNELDGQPKDVERARGDSKLEPQMAAQAAPGANSSSRRSPTTSLNESLSMHHSDSSLQTAGAKVDSISPDDKGGEKAAESVSSGSSHNNKSTPLTSQEPSKLHIGNGEILRFDRVTRNDMGYYICIASNGIPPSVSQRIFLPVLFPKASQAASSGKEQSASTGSNTILTGNSKQHRKNISTGAMAENRSAHRSHQMQRTDGSRRYDVKNRHRHLKSTEPSSSSSATAAVPSSSSSLSSGFAASPLALVLSAFGFCTTTFMAMSQLAQEL